MKVFFRVHAVQRMFERRISTQRVVQALSSGETIEDYSSEMPEPGRLILSLQNRRPVHVVTSADPNADQITVVTVYVPDPDRWHKDFRRRK